MTIKAVIAIAFYAWLFVALPGCQTMTTKAETVGADGASQKLTQKCTVPPFGKLAEGSGQMQTHLGADGSYDVATGQAAQGVDNTAQAAVVTGIVEGITKAVLAYIATPRPVETPSPTVLEQLAPLLSPLTVKGK